MRRQRGKTQRLLQRDHFFYRENIQELCRRRGLTRTSTLQKGDVNVLKDGVKRGYISRPQCTPPLKSRFVPVTKIAQYPLKITLCTSQKSLTLSTHCRKKLKFERKKTLHIILPYSGVCSFTLLQTRSFF